MALRSRGNPFANLVSALLVVALLLPDLARAAGGTAAPPPVPDPQLLPAPAPNVVEAHTNGDLAQYQAAIDTDKIGKDYATYFQALVATQCPVVIAQKKKGIIVYFKNKGSGQIFPIVVHCNDDQTAVFASAAELLRPADATTASPACLGTAQDTHDFQAALAVATTGGQAALAAATKCADGKADVELDSTCLSSLEDSLRGSIPGIERAITGRPATAPGAPTLVKQGCAETLTKVFIQNFLSTGQFMVDASKFVAKESWNGVKWVGKEAVSGGEWIKNMVAAKIFGQDNASSDAALNASAQPTSLLTELKSTDPAKLWQSLVAWAGKVISAFQAIFTDQLGCQVWSGVPMESTCLSPMSLHCISCGQLLNLSCGLIGFLGSEVLMSAMTGFALGATGRVASTVKDLVKAKIAASPGSLGPLKAMVESVRGGETLASATANGRLAVDLADRIVPGTMTGSVSSSLASLDISQAMDNIMAGYPGMMKIRKIHYGALGEGREMTDAWIASLSSDGTFVETAHNAALFKEFETTYEVYAKKVAKLVRASPSGRLSALQIADIEKDFGSGYLTKVQESLKGTGTIVTPINDNGSLQLLDQSAAAQSGGLAPENSFIYKPGINPEALTNLSAKDSAAAIEKQLMDGDDFLRLKAQVAAGETLPPGFPAGLQQGFVYSANREVPSNALQRFSTNEAGRQYGRMQLQNRLNTTLGVNPNSSFVVISSEIF